MSKELLTVALTAIAMGVVMGLFKGIEWIVSKYKNTPAAPAPSPPAHWTEVTGEVRPMTASECRDKHDKLEHDLARGSDKFAAQAETLNNVEKAVLEMKGEVKAGFAAIPGEMQKVVDDAIDRHERSAIHRPSYQTLPKANQGGGRR